MKTVTFNGSKVHNGYMYTSKEDLSGEYVRAEDVPQWISVKDAMPVANGVWSANDFLCACLYTYEIGRTRNGLWVDMGNKPIEVTHYMELTLPPQGMEE